VTSRAPQSYVKRFDVDMVDLYQQVAQHLAGRDVELEFRHMAGYDGLAMQRNGKALVYVRPGMAAEKELSVFLHEVSHAKNDAGGFAPSTTAAILASFSEVPDPPKSISGKMMELRADAQALSWGNWAKSHSKLGPTVFARLVALLHYPAD